MSRGFNIAGGIATPLLGTHMFNARVLHQSFRKCQVLGEAARHFNDTTGSNGTNGKNGVNGHGPLSSVTDLSDGEAAVFNWQRIRHHVQCALDDSPLAHPKYIQSPKTVEIIGAPMTFGQPLVGPDHGPELLRSKGLRSHLADLNWRVHDQGDLTFKPPSANDEHLPRKMGKAKNAVAVGRGSKVLCEAVEKVVGQQRFPLVIGGDHSIGLGSIAGCLHHNPNVGVLWIDAHADINTPATSASGNLHGMPLAFLMRAGGLDPAMVPGHEWLTDVPVLDPSQLVYVGLRDVDEGEVTFIRELGIRHFTMKHVDRHGIGDVMAMALDYLADRPIHMSFDIDAVDPEHAPSTGTLVRGGLTWREAHYICEAVFESGALASMDMVEVNPSLSLVGEGASRTAEFAVQLIQSAMGNSIIPRLG